MSDVYVGDDKWRDVRLVCTDKKTHPSREILVISRDETNGDLSEIGNGQTTSGRTVWRSGATPATREDAVGRAWWDLPACPTCHRAPDVSSERMRLLVAGILADTPGRHVSFDVSFLD